MKRRYVLSRPAEKDLDQITAYLAQEGGTAVARRVLREIRGALRFLGLHPEVGHFREDLTQEPLRFWAVYSYLIIYDPAKRPIEVARIIHGARDVSALFLT